MQEACAPSATSTPTPPSGAAGEADGESAGIFQYHSERRVGHLDLVVDERDPLSLSPGIGNVSAEGTQRVTPQDSITYTLTATGPGGSADANVHITVSAPPPPLPRPPSPRCRSYSTGK